LGALLAGCAAGCDLPGKPTLADQYVPPQKEMRFKVLFQQNCVACHGADAKLGPAPPLNDSLFLALVPDAELERVIAGGRSGTLMPAFASAKGGELTAEQVKVVAEGIKPHWGQYPAASGAPPYLPQQSKPGDRHEGLKVFARACASCHGDHGQGGRYGGQPDGKPVGAISDADFLALISAQALRRYVITGRPDLGMPDYADPMGRPEGFKPLTSQEVTDIVALLVYWKSGGSVNEQGK
jgi:cytochrome c oxidase cbb3-type subunit 3/ubiquinol-cytochrome c reductase cytochrome c subunit